MEQRTNYDALMHIARELIEAIGEDPTQEGLQEAPRRFASWWSEFIDYWPGETETSFISSADFVCVTGMRVYSICEHHLLPFWCDVSIAYIPDGTVLGLSKFARIAQQFAHRLQIQEQLCQQIAEEVMRLTASRDVAIHVKGEHLCMTMRGIRTPTTIISTTMQGAFRENSALRADFLRMASTTS